MNNSQNADSVSFLQFNEGDLIGGEYTVCRVFGGVGKSGQGVVYLVTSRESPKPFVLKTIIVGADATSSARFIREAEIWVNIGIHPYIVQAYWVERIDEQLFIAAEYIAEDSEGRNTLTDYLQEGMQPLGSITRWALQFCEGMEFAIQKGLVAHRDIKPDNIMINQAGCVKITDFGLAKANAVYRSSDDEPREREKTDAQSLSALTQENSIFGTLTYMAPEQFLNSKAVDRRADIYSFGIVLYQLISGGEYPYDINLQAINPFLEFARAHNSSKAKKVFSPFYPIVEKCLQKKSENRFQTFSELRGAILEIANKYALPTPLSIPIGKKNKDEELYVKAQSYVALGNPQKALEAIDTYISRCPEYPDGWTEKGRICLEIGDLNSSIRATRESIARDPQNTHAWNNLGVALNRLESWKEASEAFRKAIEYDPYNTGSMMQLAFSLVYQRHFEEAVKWLVTALKLRPKKSTLIFNASNMSAIMSQKGYVLGTQPLLETLVQLEPKNVTNWFNLALVYQATNNTNEAIRCFREVEIINPTDEIALLSLANLYAKNGKIKDGLTYCDKALAISADSEKALLLKAQLLAYDGEYIRAIRLLDDALHKYPKRDTFWYILATIHERQGNRNEALRASLNCKDILVRLKANPENLSMVNEMIQRLQVR